MAVFRNPAASVCPTLYDPNTPILISARSPHLPMPIRLPRMPESYTGHLW